MKPLGVGSRLTNVGLSIRELNTRPRAAPEWIIPNLLKRANTLFIGGPPKSCKSWLGLNLAWDLALGQPVWGLIRERGGPLFPSGPRRVVYCTQEDTEDDLQDRVLAILADGRADTEDRLFYVPKDLRIKLDVPAGYEMLREELDKVAKDSGAIDLVILDPMRRFHVGNENDSQHMVDVWIALENIHRRYNCATLFVHQTIKPPSDPDANYDLTSPFSMRGSGDIYGGGDAFVMVVPRRPSKEKNRHRLELHFETRLAAAIDPVNVVVNSETGEVVFAGFAGRKAVRDPLVD